MTDSASSRSSERSRRDGSVEQLEGRRAPIKAALLDQRTVAGLGNIYVDEALWRAQVHPLRPAGALDEDELARLTRCDQGRPEDRSQKAGREPARLLDS